MSKDWSESMFARVIGLAGLAACVSLASGGAVAQTSAAGYCNAYAADVAAGRPGGPYPVSAEDKYMRAYRLCMKDKYSLTIWDDPEPFERKRWTGEPEL